MNKLYKQTIRPILAMLLLSGSWGRAASSATSAATATSPPAVTANVSDVRGASGTSGGKALIAYTVRHDVNSHVDPGAPLPGARVASADHLEAFRGAYGDSLFAAAWLSPQGIIQLTPSSQLYENTYFFDRLQGVDPFGNQQGIAMEAGDHVELAVENVTQNAAMLRDVPRGAATGHLTWDLAKDSRNVTASYGTLTGDMDTVFVRADIVARGGDVDARTQALATDPLVIDLPKIYAPTAQGGYIITTFFPAAQYVKTMRMRVEPEMGKAFLEATVQGYIPAANEYTLPSGAQINEWHLPLNAIITIKPTGGLTASSSMALPAGGRAVAGVGNQTRELDVPVGGSVIATTDGKITLLEGNAGSQSAAAAQAATAHQEEIAVASAINHSTSAPVDLTAGDYGVTLDPDFRGQGILALRSPSRLQTGTAFADALAVPFVLIDGAPVILDRSRLVDLRVYPDYAWVVVSFTNFNEPALPSRTTTLSGAGFEAGLAVQAVYSLGDERYAFVQTTGFHFSDKPGYIHTRVTILSLATGRRVASAPVEYMEIPFSGPITYNGETKLDEFSAPVDGLSPNMNLVLGHRSFDGTVFSSSTASDGLATVVRAPGPLTGLPQPNPGLSLDGRPAALYYVQSPSAPTTPTGLSVALVHLDSDLAPQPQPKPIDEQCTAPQIDDGPISDAPPALDVKSAWFDVDDANLYASIKVANLPSAAPAGTTYSWAMHWRNGDIASYGRAILDSNGNFTFEYGPYNLSSVIPSYSKQADVTGDYKLGPDGIVRIWIPWSLLAYDAPVRMGDLLRDTSARSQITESGLLREVDQAPNGSNAVYGTGGDYLIKKCGSTAAVILTSAVSRKVHGDGATFDIDLPLTGKPGIECRSGGANKDYQVVFTFPSAVTFGSATATPGNGGTGSVSSTSRSADGKQVTVNLTNVSNVQKITITLLNVNDGSNTNDVGVQMRVVIGDTNGNGTVNSSDVSQTKAQSGAAVTSSNFREDVTVDGSINSSDISLVKSKSGSALP